MLEATSNPPASKLPMVFDDNLSENAHSISYNLMRCESLSVLQLMRKIARAHLVHSLGHRKPGGGSSVEILSIILPR